MIDTSAPASPAAHAAAREIARRFVHIVGAVLRDEEKALAEREAYLAAREVIDNVYGKDGDR